MDLTVSRNGEAKAIPVERAPIERVNGEMSGSVPLSELYGKRPATGVLAVRLSKEDRKQMADKINYDLFEQIAVERSEIAFSEFYDRFAPRVYSMLLRLVRTKEDANDL